MNLTDITNTANAFTDENFQPTVVLHFVNKAISEINTELKCRLPIFSDVTTNYTALATKWIMSLLVPYACYSIKMNDGSLNEADRYLVTFNDNFIKLISDKENAISKDYREDEDDFNGIYQRDLSTGINAGLFNIYSDDDEGF
jgi:hypothetical protein